MQQRVKSQVDQMVQSVQKNQFQNPSGHAYMVRELTRNILRVTAKDHLARFTFNASEALTDQRRRLSPRCRKTPYAPEYPQ